MPENSTAKKLTGSVLAIILLGICLMITTFALIWASVSVDNNLFHTGKIDINLNDGKPVIQEHEFLFEPGMTVEKEFFIKNDSTWSVYYKIYLDQVSGGLADVLEITIKDGEKVLCQGTATQLGRQGVSAAEESLQIQEKRVLTACFYYPEDFGNETKNLDLSFTICADAVQTKNNPNRLFD